jgi:hypothetical protein
MSNGESPFWNAYNGSNNLAEVDESEIEEAQVDRYASADEAVLALPREPKKEQGTSKKRLLAFIGIPLVLLLAIIALRGGGSSPASAPAVPQQTVTVAPVVTPVIPAQQAQVAVSHGKRGGSEIVKLAKSLIQSHFTGKTPTEAEVNAYVDKELQLTSKTLQISQLSPNHYLITYTTPDGTPVIQSINTGP